MGKFWAAVYSVAMFVVLFKSRSDVTLRDPGGKYKKRRNLNVRIWNEVYILKHLLRG